MHARVVTIQTQLGKMEEAIRIYRDSLIPAAKEQKGFKRRTAIDGPWYAQRHIDYLVGERGRPDS